MTSKAVILLPTYFRSELADWIALFGLADAPALQSEITMTSSNRRTRLNPFSKAETSLLHKAGYAEADASQRIRKLAVDIPRADFGRLSQIK